MAEAGIMVAKSELLNDSTRAVTTYSEDGKSIVTVITFRLPKSRRSIGNGKS
jgi:hypothetical protein